MLEYEWGNPSTIILAGNEGGAATEPGETHRQILDHNCTFLLPDHFLISQPLQGPTTPATATTCFSHHHHSNNPLPQPHQHHHPFFDPRAFPGASPNSLSPLPSSVLFPDPIPPVNARLGPGTGLRLQDVCPAVEFVGPGLGLNLGGRTYFATSNNDDDDSVNRLYRRYKTVESHSAASSNSPRCQAQGCNVDLSDAKHYHRRHKVCEFHSKAATVIAAGLTQRFCQQCSRFHLLSEFDNGKRSCRRRLADHNRRRRKLQQPISQEIQKSHPTLDNVTRSSPNSGTQSSSSVMVTESPPDYFRQRPHQIRGSSTTSGSFFFSNG